MAAQTPGMPQVLPMNPNGPGGSLSIPGLGPMPMVQGQMPAPGGFPAPHMGPGMGPRMGPMPGLFSPPQMPSPLTPLSAQNISQTPPTFLPMMGLGGPGPQAYGMNGQSMAQLGPASAARYNPGSTTSQAPAANGVMAHLAAMNMGGTGFNGFNAANPFANMGSPGIAPW